MNDSSLTGGFLSQPVTTPTGTGLFGTSTAFTSTEAIIPQSERITSVFDSLQDSTNRILEGINNSFLRVTERNLIGLGEASLDISSALNENITIREEQRKIDVEQVENQQIQINVLNERLSKQVSELGESLSNIGSGGFDPIGFLTDNPLLGGIGIGGLLVGGVVLFLVLR